MPDGVRIPTLNLFGVVGEDFFGDGFTERTVSEFLGEHPDAEEVHFNINSGGGFVDSGLSVYNIIRAFPGKTRITNVGVAGSAASIIFMAADERLMGDGTLFFVHHAWNVTIGNASDHRKSAETLDKQSEQLARIYSSRAGIERDEVWALMDEESWLDPDEAVAKGFATGLIPAKTETKALASLRLDHLSLKSPLPKRIASARTRYPDLVPMARTEREWRTAAAARQIPASLTASQERPAVPSTAVEVTTENPMTNPATSAASNPAEQNPQTNPQPQPGPSQPTQPTPQPAPQPQQAPPQEAAERNVVPIDPDAQARAQAAGAIAERERIMEINRICMTPLAMAAFGDTAAALAFANALVADKVPVAQAREKLFDHMNAQAERAQPQTSNFTSVVPMADEREKWLEGQTAWILTKAGLGKMMEKATGKKLDPGEFRGMTMLRIAEDALEMNGERSRRMDARELVGRAFTMKPKTQALYVPSRAAITQTTSDFSVLMENAMNKTLFAAYNTQADKWRTFTATGSVPDFRPFPRYRLGSFGSLDKKPEAAEYKYKAIPDGEKTLIQVETRGNRVNITREAIINDDLGFLNNISVGLGRAARLSIEIDVFALLGQNAGLGPTMGDGLTLFHASHGNIGTGGAPSVTTFDEIRQLIGKQRDLSGNEFLDIAPDVWLGPLSLGATTRVLVQAQYDPSVSNKFMVPNAVNGMLANIVDTARLSGTRWYVFANPAVSPVFEVVFLNGQEDPFVDQTESWSVDGTEYKVRLDYGVGAIDYRGAATNAGV